MIMCNITAFITNAINAGIRARTNVPYNAIPAKIDERSMVEIDISKNIPIKNGSVVLSLIRRKHAGLNDARPSASQEQDRFG